MFGEMRVTRNETDVTRDVINISCKRCSVTNGTVQAVNSTCVP